MMMAGIATAQAEPDTIKIGSLGWEDVYPLSLIGKKVLEKGGFKVEIVKFSEWGIANAALAKGDVDLLISLPNYVTADYWAKFKHRLEKISPVSYGNFQGFVVPSYVPINSIDQLNTISDKVGGKIVGIEPGSGLMHQVHDAVKAYGLNYQVIDGSTAAMTAELQSALERKEPIVTMLWKPSWMALKFDVKFLKDPKHVMQPLDTYYWTATRGFSEKHPHAREAIASMYVPLDDITALNVAINEGKTFEQAVDAWWDQNKAVVDSWAIAAAK